MRLHRLSSILTALLVLAPSLASARVQPTCGWPGDQVVVGYGHTCVLEEDGEISCWGSNTDDGASAPAGSFVQVSAAWDVTCGLREDGSASCSGGSYGPLEAPAGDLVALAAGSRFICALRRDGTAACTGNLERSDAWFPVLSPPSGPFVQISTGSGHACALRSDGTAACWGSGEYGVLDVPPDARFRMIDAGHTHNCGILESGEIECWGWNLEGELRPPEGVFVDVAVGLGSTCAIREDATVSCWGNESGDGALGELFSSIDGYWSHYCGLTLAGVTRCWGVTPDARAMVPKRRFVQVEVGKVHACGIWNDRSVSCWSWNGSLAYGKTDPPTGAFDFLAAGSQLTYGIRSDGSIVRWWPNGDSEPVPGAYRQLGIGHSHVCGLKEDGSIQCWGNDLDGRATAPDGVYVRLAVGLDHSCAIRADGSAICWGRDIHGQSEAPAGHFLDIAAGDEHTCAVREQGTIACWGNNSRGQAVAPPGSFLKVAADSFHTCAIQSDGTLRCWGDRGWERQSMPSGSFVQISAGNRETCGIRVDGSMACWGAWGTVMPADPLPDCGNGQLDADEECDDGDDVFAAGSSCTADCTLAVCGVPLSTCMPSPRAGDALYGLRAALGLLTCEDSLCDVNRDGRITAGDALRILRKSVDPTVELMCPGEEA